LNFYFDGVLEDQPSAATPADIDALLDFGRQWVAELRRNPFARTIVHCGAGVSRSGAAAMALLSLDFGAYPPAAVHLFRSAPPGRPQYLDMSAGFREIGTGLRSGYPRGTRERKTKALRSQ